MIAGSYSPFTAATHSVAGCVVFGAVIFATFMGTIGAWGTWWMLLWTLALPTTWTLAMYAYARYAWRRPAELIAYLHSVGFESVSSVPDVSDLRVLPCGAVFAPGVLRMTHGGVEARVRFMATATLPGVAVAVRCADSRPTPFSADVKYVDLPPHPFLWKRYLDRHISHLYAIAEHLP